MEEYCPNENLKAMLSVLTCGGFRGMMAEPGLDEYDEIYESRFDYAKDIYPGMPVEQRNRMMYFEFARDCVETRGKADDLFRYFPEIPFSKHGEEWMLKMMERRGEIEGGIRENLAAHVDGCVDCSKIYLEFLFDHAKFSKEFDQDYSKHAPSYFKEIIGNKLGRNVGQRISDLDSELLSLLQH